MRTIWAKLAIAVAAVFTVAATPAMAQATRTWISGVGDDANPCSRTAPCKTFAGAISKTAATGEINVLDPGGFGGVTITKSITLRADHVEGGVLVAASNGIVINAGVNDKVVIEGLDIEGLSTIGGSLSGINIIQARDVVVKDTNIRGFQDGTEGNGILISGATAVSLSVENSFIFNNRIGINVRNTASNGRARVYNSAIVSNLVAGIRVAGANNAADISGNRIIRSPKGLEILSGGVINSYGDNVLTTGDAPTLVPKG
jgi:hypothetical protein